MSESTIAKLVMAQRDRELRAEQRWSVADLVGLPLAAVFLLFVLVWALVVWIIGSIGRLGPRADEMGRRDTHKRDAPRQ